MWQIRDGGTLWQARREYRLASEGETLSAEVISATFVPGLQKDWPWGRIRNLTTTSQLKVQGKEEALPETSLPTISVTPLLCFKTSSPCNAAVLKFVEPFEHVTYLAGRECLHGRTSVLVGSSALLPPLPQAVS